MKQVSTSPLLSSLCSAPFVTIRRARAIDMRCWLVIAFRKKWWHRWNLSAAYASKWVYHEGKHPLVVQKHIFGTWHQRRLKRGAKGNQIFYFDAASGFGQWEAPPLVVHLKQTEAHKCRA